MFKSKPKSLRRIVIGRFFSSAIVAIVITATLAFVASQVPVRMDMVDPGHGAAAVQEHQQATLRAMSKCDTLPANTLPGAVVLDYANKAPFYTTNPRLVDMAFGVAVGETPMPVGVAAFKLCK